MSVESILSPPQDSLEAAKAWIAKMAERGIYPSTTATSRKGAIEALESIIAEDEPHSASWFLQNIADITRRWTIKTSANPATSSTYESRAKVGVEHYFEYLKDPQGFKIPGRASTNDAAAATPRRERKADAKPSKHEPPPPFEPPPPRPAMRTFPIGQGAEFRFELPANGVTVDEVRRIAFHLLTLATDFDPSAPNGGFTLSRARE